MQEKQKFQNLCMYKNCFILPSHQIITFLFSRKYRIPHRILANVCQHSSIAQKSTVQVNHKGSKINPCIFPSRKTGDEAIVQTTFSLYFVLVGKSKVSSYTFPLVDTWRNHNVHQHILKCPFPDYIFQSLNCLVSECFGNLKTRGSADMLVKLIIFCVDLMLASAIVGTLSALYLIVATGTFIFAIFYIFTGDMRKNYDLHKDSRWVLESSNATGKPLAENTERVNSLMLPGHFPAFRPMENESSF